MSSLGRSLYARYVRLVTLKRPRLLEWAQWHAPDHDLVDGRRLGPAKRLVREPCVLALGKRRIVALVCTRNEARASALDVGQRADQHAQLTLLVPPLALWPVEQPPDPILAGLVTPGTHARLAVHVPTTTRKPPPGQGQRLTRSRHTEQPRGSGGKAPVTHRHPRDALINARVHRPSLAALGGQR